VIVYRKRTRPHSYIDMTYSVRRFDSRARKMVRSMASQATSRPQAVIRAAQGLADDLGQWLFVNGLVISPAHSMKGSMTGLNVRFFSVAIATHMVEPGQPILRA
jgi:hypothetical protein